MSDMGAVLVTGGAGYIGSHVVLALRDGGRHVVVLDDLSTGVRQAVPADVPFVLGDVGDAALLSRTLREHGVGAVMHFAGSIVVPESVRDPLAYYRNNALKSLVLIEACVAQGVNRFVFSSTAAVYGIPDVVPVSEDAGTRPINPYGTSKLMTEWILRDTAVAHALRYAALRYFNVAGADPAARVGQSTPAATHLIKVACEAAVGIRPGLDVFGTDYPTPDGTCVRDYIHVSDLASAHLLALRHLEGGGESLTLNCGYGRGYSVKEVLGAVERACGNKLRTRLGPRRPGDPPCLVAAADRLRRTLDWRPRHDDLDTIVGTALAWERSLAAAGKAPGRASA
jgi:UDP-glucose 4-epimerase